MKRLLVIFAMVCATEGVSWAAEVKLRCTAPTVPYDNKVQQMSFDEERHTVNGHGNPSTEERKSGDYSKIFISETEFGEIAFDDNTKSYKQTVDRATGEFTYEEWYSDGNRKGRWTGTCVKFEQKF